MIVIVSSQPRERAALAALCASHRWVCLECDSARAFRKLIRTERPRVVLTRHKISDGYSDDILAALGAAALLPATKVMVMLAADTPGAQQARQVSLGADTVHRDPVRADVLAAFLEKFLALPPVAGATTGAPRRRRPLKLAGAAIDVVERRLRHGAKVVSLTPRELQLAELLAASRGEIVTYTALYGEILGTSFSGNTANLRVLLSKLDASYRSLGLDLRRHVEVVPKSGFRCHVPGPAKLRLARPARTTGSRAA